MKTEDLITALAADRRRLPPMGRQIVWAIAGGLPVSLVIFFAVLGLRPDFAPAMATWQFDAKVAITFAAAALAVMSARQAALPFGPRRPGLLWLIPVALLACVAVEMATAPRSEWLTRLLGSNAAVCLVAIPVLAAAPLALILLVMRGGAPAHATSAGALAGLTAAALASALYGLHCFDDSPLFVATWYTLASLLVVAVGAACGRTWLRW